MAGIIIFTFLLLISCENTTDSDMIVARVGPSVLTKDDITNQALGSGRDDEESRITQWVNVELLYRERYIFHTYQTDISHNY